ncbi:MAG: FAD-dependent oxidoreductase [Oscillospiraceae bacterium]|jgi:NAD(P)H-nitrite reductase large subunit|nr:FAD-dependent oxidoreductase [Oscillospiraceae bacterium]
MPHFVIIGNSAAAIGAIEGFRRIDSDSKITLISDEPHHTYGRPLISYLLLGKTDRERMLYRPADFYEKNGVTAKLGARATKIDAAAKTVALDSGETVSYDKLLYGAGSSPFVPPMDGLEDVKRKYTFQTLDSALALGEALTEVGANARVLIIGAGLIGLKCAEGIREKCASITFVDLADRVLPSILDAQASDIIKSACEAEGLAFRLGTSVASFTENTATLATGEKLEFDILVLAVGVRPNTALLKDAGVKVERGVVIDEFSRTSNTDIYAAGDCCEQKDVVTGESRIMAVLPNAYMQGEAAGLNAAGVSVQFDKAFPLNAIGFFGKHVLSAGFYDGEETAIVEGNNYKKFFVRDNKLRGFILIGSKHPEDGEIPAYERAGIITDLIRRGTDLSTVDFKLLTQHPALAAFGQDVRREYLGEEH